MTILEVIQRSAEFLAKKGVPSPRLQVELLLAHVLKMPRMNLYLNFARPLDPAALDTLRALVQRRALREPLQHITGLAPFCGFDLLVNKNVLIPRPETEALAERAWKFLASLPAAAGPPLALDLGSGSGALALALALNVPAALICAADLSTTALDLARQNAERLQVTGRIRFAPGDLFAALDSQSKFHLIVSNPPYLPTAALAGLDPEVRDFEPRSALDGGPDGQDFYRRIAAQALPFLHPGGRLMLELDEDGAAATHRIFQDAGWIVEPLEPDLNGKPRILIARASD